jgi:hypothetical protein
MTDVFCNASTFRSLVRRPQSRPSAVPWLAFPFQQSGKSCPAQLLEDDVWLTRNRRIRTLQHLHEIVDPEERSATYQISRKSETLAGVSEVTAVFLLQDSRRIR